jgi:hypothetical protein
MWTGYQNQHRPPNVGSVPNGQCYFLYRVKSILDMSTVLTAVIGTDRFSAINIIEVLE